jgi:NTE family protein
MFGVFYCSFLLAFSVYLCWSIVKLKTDMYFKIYPAFFLIFILFFFGINSSFAQNDSTTKSKRPKVGLVMSGGGAKGFAYIGLLKVMHESGLEVDYIGGSSIGSIVAGFYALGYHPDTMASIIRAQNWDDLLIDKIDRKYISYDEKEFGDSYIMDFPIRKKKVGLKASLYEGQEINLLLNRFYSPAYKTTDFKDFQTPFLCIGTDLIEGKEVVMDSGYLATAIRASMSIPGYFSPTYYDGKYIVDGGVVNNYPVIDVKKMGAEYIIGADVQSAKKVTIEDLNTLPAVLDHIIGYSRQEANKEGYAETDTYIHYESPYATMDFQKFDSILAFGNAVAESHREEIQKLADSLNAIEFKPIKEYKTMPLDSVYIDKLVVVGNKRTQDKYFENSFGMFENSWVSLDDLEEEIRLAYGSGFFNHIFYELHYENGKTNLVLKVDDESVGFLSVAAHYDDDYAVGLILAGTFRNILGKGSKVFTDLVISPNPRFRAMYVKDNGGKPGYGAKLEAYAFEFNDYQKGLEFTNQVQAKIRFTNYKLSLFVQSIIKNTLNFRVGANFEYFRFKSKIEDTNLDSISDFNAYANLYFSFNTDTRDRSYLSTRGVKSELRVEYVMPVSSSWIEDLFENSLVFWFKYEQSIPLIGKKVVLRPGLFAGGTYIKGFPVSSDLPAQAFKRSPAQYWFFLGGQSQSNYLKTIQPFTGVDFLQRYGLYQYTVNLDLQYNFYSKLYLTLMGNIGANTWFLGDLFTKEQFIVGYGLKFSYDSYIGPVELSVMGSNIYKGVSTYIAIGFWF